jgi:hypothetical protein
MFGKVPVTMAYRIYIENVSNIPHNQTLFTYRGNSVPELESDIRNRCFLPTTVRIEVYNKRFGSFQRHRVSSLNDLPKDHDSLHVFLRPQ